LDRAVWRPHLGNQLAKPCTIRLACQQGRGSTVKVKDPSQRSGLFGIIGQEHVGAPLAGHHSDLEQRRRGELTRLND